MERQPTQENKSVFSSLSSQDIKLLVITFVATLTANLITVIFVGGAIALVRSDHNQIKTNLPLIILATIMLPVAIITVFTLYSRIRKAGNWNSFYDDTTKRTTISLFTGYIFVTIFLLLYWVGIASGIK